MKTNLPPELLPYQSATANSVNALKELQKLAYDEFVVFELYMRYVSEYLAGLEKQS